MVAYFVNHTEPRETALREANIPFEFFVMRQKGFLVEGVHCEAMLRALHSYAVEEIRSEYEGIHTLNIRRGTPEPGVVVPAPQPREVQIKSELVGRNATYMDDFDRIAKEYGKRLNAHKIIFFDNEQAYPAPQPPRPTVEGRYTIFFWCTSHATSGNGRSSVRQNGMRTPHSLWGKDTTIADHEGYWSAYLPSGNGVLIKDSAGVEVAEVIGNNIYIFYPVTHRQFRSGPRVFQKIMEECVKYLTMSPEELEAHYVKVREAERLEQEAREACEKIAREERKPRSRKSYIESCSGRYKKALEGTRKAIKEGHTEIEQLQATLTRRIRETIGAERKLAQMEAQTSGFEEVYGREFDKLSVLPKVVEVLAEGGLIKVFTETLYCVDPRSKKNHEIGRFQIDINPSGKVQWKNLTRVVDGFYAPHVKASGTACLGTMTEIIPELAGNYEFAALAMVCVQFIESVNVDDDWGRRIHMWPVAA
jgi:hypothetical protein